MFWFCIINVWFLKVWNSKLVLLRYSFLLITLVFIIKDTFATDLLLWFGFRMICCEHFFINSQADSNRNIFYLIFRDAWCNLILKLFLLNLESFHFHLKLESLIGIILFLTSYIFTPFPLISHFITILLMHHLIIIFWLSRSVWTSYDITSCRFLLSKVFLSLLWHQSMAARFSFIKLLNFLIEESILALWKNWRINIILSNSFIFADIELRTAVIYIIYVFFSQI